MKRRWALAAGLAAASIGVAAGTKRGRGRWLDERIYAFVNGRLENRLLDKAFAALTELGSMYASAAAGGSLALAGRGRTAVRAVGAATTTWAVGQFLKKVYGRPRPFLSTAPGRLLIGRPQGTSWPSIHPATLRSFVAVATRDLDAGGSGRTLAVALPAAVAASRVYLGVHYPSDVVGGLLLGTAVAVVWTPDGSPLD